MRRVWRMYVMCIAAAFLVCDARPVHSEPLSIAPPPPLSGGTSPERFLFFAGVDLWRNSGTLYGGMLWSPRGLRHDGLTFKLVYAGGFYRYLAGTRRILGAHDMVAVLPGWRVSHQSANYGRIEATLYAGPDLQIHKFFPADPGNQLNGFHAGLRVGADLWWEPMARLMVAASLSGATIGESYSLRLATGWRMFERLWVGPEIEASGDRVYQQWRVGAHVTALKLWNFEWSLGAGYVQDNSNRSGAYGRLGLLMRR